MSSRGAFGRYGFGQVPMPKGKVNKAAKIEDNLDDNGKAVATYKMKNNPATCTKIRNDIIRTIGDEYPIIAEELTLGVLSVLANGVLLTEAEITAPQPDGIGPRPDVNDIVASNRYKVAEDAMSKRRVMEHGNYRKDVMAVKNIIKKKFMAPALLNAIQKKAEFVAAQKENISVAAFLNVLEAMIVKLSQPKLNASQRLNLSREELVRNMMELKITQTDGCADYLETMKSLMEQYREVLKKEKIRKIPINADANQRAARIQEIEDEVQEETDREASIMGTVYRKIKKYGMDPAALQLYDLMETQHYCNPKDPTSTPFTRIDDNGTIEGGFDNMIAELLDVVHAQEAKFDGQPIFYVTPKSDGERALKKQKLEINAATQQDVAVPCHFCRDELSYPQVAMKHQFEHCFYNPANKKYFVGEAKKEERIKRAKEWQAERSGRPPQSQGRGGGSNGRGRGRGGRGRGRGRGRDD